MVALTVGEAGEHHEVEYRGKHHPCITLPGSYNTCTSFDGCETGFLTKREAELTVVTYVCLSVASTNITKKVACL